MNKYDKEVADLFFKVGLPVAVGVYLLAFILLKIFLK